MGDVIEFLGEVEEGWWRGKLSGRIGVFPSNFVEADNSSSPIFANRRISNNNGTANNNNLRSATSLNSSREDLMSSGTSGTEKDAPILPPKPGIQNKTIQSSCEIRI